MNTILYYASDCSDLSDTPHADYLPLPVEIDYEMCNIYPRVFGFMLHISTPTDLPELAMRHGHLAKCVFNARHLEHRFQWSDTDLGSVKFAIDHSKNVIRCVFNRQYQGYNRDGDYMWMERQAFVLEIPIHQQDIASNFSGKKLWNAIQHI
jgi:hypothetical protein